MTRAQPDLSRVAVVIPCYRAARSIQRVVATIPAGVGHIICVDDASDDGQADVLDQIAEADPRVIVARHSVNGGVGAATVTGYRRALETGAEVMVKLDADGQMDPAFIPRVVGPILAGEADYTKGNRFFDVDSVRDMPTVRLIGNAGLSFLTKASTGYWDLFDPTNGYTAIHASVVRALPLDKLHRRYFFESDMLFRLGTLRAVVAEIPMKAIYEAEVSGLSETRALLTFPVLHAVNFVKRIGYNYFLRGFSAASLNLAFGIGLMVFGGVFGLDAWAESAATGQPATAGTVMISALGLIMGFQLLLSFLNHDIAVAPRTPIHPKLAMFQPIDPDETAKT